MTEKKQYNTMEENENFQWVNHITINIHGGTTQILPNATRAIQQFYGVGSPDSGNSVVPMDMEELLTEEESRLALYIADKETREGYLRRLGACISVTELAMLVVEMALDVNTKVDKERMVQEQFLSVLLPLAPRITGGTSISNIRQRVNDAWAKRKRTIYNKV